MKRIRMSSDPRKTLLTPEQHRDFVATAFAQEREAIVKQLWQIRQDMDSYNENQKPTRPLVFVFDFRNDVDELEAGEHSTRS